MDATLITYRWKKTRTRQRNKWITGKEKVQVEKDCKVTDITLNHKKVPMTFFLGDVGEVKIYMTPSEVRHLLVRLMIDAMWESPEGN